MSVMEETFVITCRNVYINFGEWYQNLHNWSVCVLQLIKNYTVPYTYWGDLHHLGGETRLDMYDLFWDDYKAFVPGDLTEFHNV